MFENLNYLMNNNSTIDFESSSFVGSGGSMQIISEVNSLGGKSSSMESVLDSYIQKRAVPLVLRKRLLYEYSLNKFN